MATECSYAIRCFECGYLFGEDVASSVPCPECGAEKKNHEVIMMEGIQFHESWRTQRRDPTRPSDKKLRQDDFQGSEWSHRLGKMVRKERGINKDTNTYYELVVDMESGDVLHYCEEPLSNHFGHGTAKKKPAE